MSVHKIQDITVEHAGRVGGKAANLGELRRAGHRVPNAFVITADERLLSPELVDEALHAFDELELDTVAVRSSGVDEDGKEQSWAGQFATSLHVTREQLANAIQACWDSAQNARVAAYAPEGAAFDLAVLVQQMVHSDTAGVAFSVNPVTGKQDEIVIEAVYGLGELLVQGLATPDNYVVDKLTGDMIAEYIAHKTDFMLYHGGRTVTVAVDRDRQHLSALSQSQVQEVATLAKNVEQYYGFPVDIEWAYQDGTLYLLQARPITTL